MNQILVLVDFTDTSEKALAQAVAIAKNKNSLINICHIINDGHEASASAKQGMESYIKDVEREGLEAKAVFRAGSLNQEVSNYVKESMPSLVLVGTHGKKGIVQHLIGSKIFKLVSGVKSTVLVVSDFSKTVVGGYSKILLPIAPHKNFILKLEEASKLVSPNGKLILFTVIKPGVELDESILENTKKAKEFMADKSLDFELVQFEATNYSVGYSKETMNYSKSNNVDMVVILTEVSDGNRYYGKLDKENLMLNEEGVAVLCVNG